MRSACLCSYSSATFLGSNNLASKEAKSSPSTRPARPQNLAMENMQNLTAALNALGVKTCLACGKAGAKSLCMGCRSVSFCGKACQKVAWPGHKKECRRIVRPGGAEGPKPP